MEGGGGVRGEWVVGSGEGGGGVLISVLLGLFMILLVLAF